MANGPWGQGTGPRQPLAAASGVERGDAAGRAWTKGNLHVCRATPDISGRGTVQERASTGGAPTTKAGRWVAEKPFSDIAGFHINELYSPWVTFAQIVTDFLLTPNAYIDSVFFFYNMNDSVKIARDTDIYP